MCSQECLRRTEATKNQKLHGTDTGTITTTYHDNIAFEAETIEEAMQSWHWCCSQSFLQEEQQIRGQTWHGTQAGTYTTTRQGTFAFGSKTFPRSSHNLGVPKWHRTQAGTLETAMQ